MMMVANCFDTLLADPAPRLEALQAEVLLRWHPLEARLQPAKVAFG